MIKDTEKYNDKIKTYDRDITILRENFPSCFNSDGSFDIEKLASRLKDKINIVEEGYELKFLGKSYSKLLTSLETLTLIDPNMEHNKLPENRLAENIFISGDNLDALKHLKKAYARQIKCIYIDPPYNTGKDDFVYNDTFNFTIENLVEKLGVEEEKAAKILDLTNRGSSSHSAWLMFMYSRLLLSFDLLARDGVILISIDDNEYANLKLICDDIYGEENYVGTIVWKNATDNNPTNIAIEHEYIVAYAKNKMVLEPVWKSKISGIKDLLINIGNELITTYQDEDELQKKYTEWLRENKSQLSPLDRYKYIDKDGVYTGSQSVHNPGKEGYRYDIIHPETKKPCKEPLMGYRFPKETMDKLIESEKILFGKDENKIVELKVYAKDFEDKLSSVFTLDGRLGAYDLRELFPESKQIFKNPKPVYLLEKIFSFVMDKESTMLDFFGGSSTSAQSILELNAQDGGNRKFIVVQLPELITENKEAFKLGYRTIDAIGRERIIRAAKKIKKDLTEPQNKNNYGFKHYNLLETPSNTLDKIEDFNPNGTVEDETIFAEYGLDVILTTWLVNDGYGFNAEVKKIDLKGYEAYSCGKHIYFINNNLSENNVEELIKYYELNQEFNPENVVLFGYSFTKWSITEMLEKNLKLLKDGSKNLKINVDIRY